MSKAKKLYYALRRGEPNEATALLAELTIEELSYTDEFYKYSLLTAALDGIRYGITYDFFEDLVNNKLPSDVFKIKDFQGNSPFLTAVGLYPAQPKAVKLILDKDPQAANDVNHKGNTAFSLVASKHCSLGSMELMHLLLQHTDNKYISKLNQSGDSPLHLASSSGNHITVKMLLDQPGIDINEKSGFFSPLSIAILSGNSDVVSVLLSAGALIFPEVKLNLSQATLNRKSIIELINIATIADDFFSSGIFSATLRSAENADTLYDLFSSRLVSKIVTLNKPLNYQNTTKNFEHYKNLLPSILADNFTKNLTKYLDSQTHIALSKVLAITSDDTQQSSEILNEKLLEKSVVGISHLSPFDIQPSIEVKDEQLTVSALIGQDMPNTEIGS